jgi:hypothetical protein
VTDFRLNDFLELGSTGGTMMAGGGDSSGEVGGLMGSAGDEGRGSFETTISEAGEAIPD